MKCKIILLLAGFLSQSSAYYRNMEDNIKKIGYVQYLIVELLGNMASHSSCDRQTIDSETEKTIQCLAEIKSNSSLCYTFTNHFKKCSKVLMDKAEDCERPLEKGIPKAFVTSLVALAEYLCNTDGEHILEIFNPCVMRSLMKDQEDCVPSFHIEMDQAVNETAVLPGLCRSTCKLKDCLAECFKDHCKNEITLDTLGHFFTSILQPCRGNLEEKASCMSV